MNSIPVMRLDICILPHCNKYITLNKQQKAILKYAFNKKQAILLVFNQSNYGSIFFPVEDSANVNIIAADVAKIKDTVMEKDIELATVEKVNFQITHQCFEYKSKILDILEIIHSNQSDILKIGVNNLFGFIQKNNIINNLYHYSVEKFIFVIYNQLFESQEDKYFALIQKDFIQLYKMCFLKIKEILNDNQLSNSVNEKIQNKIQNYHKQLFLKEKISILNEELGVKSEFEELEADIEKLPEKPRKIALQELKRLEKMPSVSSESGIIRNYIKCLLDLPWNKTKEINSDMKSVKKIIDKSHIGLEKIKHQIELLLVSKIRSNQLKNSPILLCGPPGVGKTSIVKSIAKALDLPYATISLSGLSDSTVLMGTMRAYLGAMPGKFIQTIKQLGYLNGIIHLDEVDKMGNDVMKSPMNALISILDPTQNDQFQDLYLDVEFNFQQILFILTANSTSNIPSPILNRVNVIDISGYSMEEKKNILPRIISDLKQELNIGEDEVVISPTCFDEIIENYTIESGVRQLSMVVKNLLQTALLKIECSKTKTNIVINKKNLKNFTDRKVINKYQVKNYPGCCTGLAWTSLGGKVCPVETVIHHNDKAKLIITGNLGQVMKESVQVAVSQLSRILDKNFHQSQIHLHCPEASIPKDGPSAGITIFSALYSYANNISLPENLAMTGELTLSGKVTEIGGLKEKLIAAVQHGITKVIIPQDNSITDIPSNITNKLQIVKINHIDQIIEHLTY